MAYDPQFADGKVSEARYDKAVAEHIKANARKGAFKRWISEAPDHQELNNWLNACGEYFPKSLQEHPLRVGMYDGSFGDLLADLAVSLRDHGKLSPKQTDIVRKSLARAKERLATKAEREAQWKAEAANLPPVPETDERIDIVAEILSTKEVEGMYGWQTKALYKTDAGYKLWGSVPSKISEAKKGDRVQFSAKVSRSDDDPSFGFISRPTKAKIILRKED
tara:strand:+ start:450 stop:1112 length:663 start_codon:yes stop_codon:yes gene_type:complete